VDEGLEATVSTRNESSEVARHIARVAAHLFATQGYDATSVRTIVEVAGVTKPTLYYHFGSKEGLAHALLTVPLAGLARALRGVQKDERDPVVALERTIETHFAFCREDPDRLRILYSLGFGQLGSGLKSEMEQVKQEMAHLMEAPVRRLADAGVISKERVDACTTAYRGLIVISTLDYLCHGKELGTDLAHRLVGDLLHGFGEPEYLGRGPSK
jgi:AcrR family transcriptional regulator